MHSESQVEIRFIARMSHGAMSLRGQVQDDSIRGAQIKHDQTLKVVSSGNEYSVHREQGAASDEEVCRERR